MSRKPSTCSLPAALLTENRVATPSSSVDGLSPTDSTCSLDKATLIISQTSVRQGDMYYPLNGSASLEGQASYELKAVTAAQSGRDGTLKSSVRSSSLTSPSSPHSHPHQTPTLSPPTSSDVESDVSKSTLTRSSVGVAGGVSSSWADRLDDAGEDEREARTPEWAQLHGNRGRSHTPSHTPVSKRHSAEPPDGWSHTDLVTSARPAYHIPRNFPAGVWFPRPLAPLLPNSQPPSGGRRHRGTPHSVGPLGVNGLIPSFPGLPLQRPPYLQSPAAGVLAGYPPPVFPNQGRGSHHTPPPACFNCGKKGHYGTSCPAETIDTNNPDSESN